MGKNINTGLALGIIILLAGLMGGSAWYSASMRDQSQSVNNTGRDVTPKGNNDKNTFGKQGGKDNGTAPANSCLKEENCCLSDQDCLYSEYTGGCNTPEYVNIKQEEAIAEGKYITEAPKREQVTCSCEQRRCITYEAPISVTLAEMVKDSSTYADKMIQTEGIVHQGKDNCGCYLEDGNSVIKVDCWGNYGFSPGTCPPNVKACDQPSPMRRFLDKPVKLSGVLREQKHNSLIDDSCTADGAYFITQVKDATIVDGENGPRENDPAGKTCQWEPGQCEALISEGYYFSNASGNCEHWPAKKSGCTNPPFKSLDECKEVCK